MGKKKLSETHPELVKEWHPTKNGDLTPQEVTHGSHKKVWWQCKHGHDWEVSVYHRTVGAHNCPYCAGQKVWVGFNDLATKNPELAKEWHPTLNGELTPQNVHPVSRRKVWWQCKQGHKWQATIANRFNGNDCPFCANRAVWVGFNDIATTHPELALQWHPTLNGKLTPQDVTAGSNRKVHWICERGHDWETTVCERVSDKGCPFCANRAVWIGFNDLATTHPGLASQWHPTLNGKLTPQDVTPGSNRKAHWVCERGHHWETQIVHRTNGSECPFCTNFKTLPGFNDLATTHAWLLNEWDQELNGELVPQQFTGGSGQKIWWKCHKGHQWLAPIYYRTSGTGCPKCTPSGTSFPEQSLFFYLLQVFPECLNRTRLKVKNDEFEVDLLIPEIDLAIEYDGSYWHKTKLEEEVKKNESIQKEHRFLRIREEGLPHLDEVDIIQSDYVTNGGIPPIEQLFQYILNKFPLDASVIEKMKLMTIDVERDRLKILENYQQYERRNSLAAVYPEIAKEWNDELNGLLRPEHFKPHSREKVWWTCPKGHDYESRIGNRTSSNKQGCPVCTGKKVVVGVNDLATLRPDLAKDWDYVKNGELTPQQVTVGSKKKIWWRCSQGHSWKRDPGHRKRYPNCPECRKEGK